MSTKEAENENEATPSSDPEPTSDPVGDGKEAVEGEARLDDAKEQASDEQPSDEQPSDEQPSTEQPSQEKAAVTSTPKSAGSKAAMTPGQRLAAARASKAAKKRDQRGRGAEDREQRVIDSAASAGEAASRYLETNRRGVAAAIGAVILAGVAFFGYRAWHSNQERDAAALLDEANRIQLAPLASELDDSEATLRDSETPRFSTSQERAEAAAAKYRDIADGYSRTDAAAWALLGLGRALLDTGDAAEARNAYERARAAADGEAALERSAIEGLGFTYEAEQNWDEALSVYEELGTIANGAFETWSDYHVARMLIRKGDEEQAKQRLSAVMEKLRASEGPRSSYLEQETERRLAILDPSLGQAPQGPAGGGGLSDLSPERLQELIRQAQQQQQGQPSETP